MSADDPLGFDFFLGGPDDDLDPTGRSATGVELVDAAILHRLTTEKIEVIDAPNGEIDFGIIVSRWCGEPIDDSGARAKAPLVDAALQLDPRIQSTQVDVSLAPPGTTFPDESAVDIVITLRVLLKTGQTIDRIVGVSAVTVAFLAGA